MRVGVLGSGAVGQAIAKGLLAEGHEVWLATHEPKGEKGEQLKTDIEGATITDFATAAKEAELAIFTVKWEGAEETAGLIGAENLAGKVVVDTSNVIVMESNAMVYGDAKPSAGELVQQWFPETKVVKAFNTIGAAWMYKPEFAETPTMFIAGDDDEAKKLVTDTLVTPFGWNVLDTGALLMSRHLEPMAMVWINYAAATNWSEAHAFKML
jgi:predicted dinucleotide-binding enzyme